MHSFNLRFGEFSIYKLKRYIFNSVVTNEISFILTAKAEKNPFSIFFALKRCRFADPGGADPEGTLEKLSDQKSNRDPLTRLSFF